MPGIKATLGLAAARLLNSPSPELDAELVLAHILKKSREWLIANPDFALRLPQLTQLFKLISRRAKGEPVAYLTGHKEFFGLDFMVNKHVLIPRPETELLVEMALAIASRRSPVAIHDLGTGSGNIIISLAKTLEKPEYDRSIYHTLQLFGIDASEKALKIARQNAKRHKVTTKIKFTKSNLLAKFLLTAHSQLPITIFLANLPYLTPAQYRANPELKFEPKNALVAGQDGLKYYKQLFRQISSLLIYQPINGPATKTGAILLLEIDPPQKQLIQKLAKKIFPRGKIKFHKDLANNYRVCEIVI